jgi:hypothetical protein
MEAIKVCDFTFARNGLLIDEVFGARLHTSRLHTEDGLVRPNARQERVSPEAFPIPATCGNTAQVHHWAESDIDSLADVLFTHCNATGAE